jgi:hypothetical protein
VLKLSRLAQQVGQLLAIPHHDRGLSPHRRNVSPAMIALNDADTGTRQGMAEVNGRRIRTLKPQLAYGWVPDSSSPRARVIWVRV